MIKFILNKRKLFILIYLVFIVLAALSLLNIKINSTVYVIEENHQGRKIEKVFHEVFTETNEKIFVSVGKKDKSAIDYETIEKIRYVSSYIENKYPSILRVTSVDNSYYINEGDLGFSPVYSDDSVLHSNKIKKSKLLNKIVSNSEVNELSIVFETGIKGDDAKKMKLLYSDITAAMENTFGEKYNIYFSGGAAVATEVEDIVKRDNVIFFPVVSLIIMLMLWVVFKNWLYILSPMLITSLTVLFTMSLMPVFNVSLNIITVVLPVFIVTISVCDALHFQERFRLYISEGKGKEDAIIGSFNDLVYPMFLTSITTACGFYALTLTDLSFVRSFGIFSSLGSLIAYVLTVTILPIVIYVFPDKKFQSFEYSSSLTNIFYKLYRALTNHRIVSIFLLVSLFVTSAYFASKVDVGFSNIDSFSQDSEIIKNVNHIHENYHGSILADVLISNKNDSNIDMLDVNTLKQVDKLQKELESLEGVTVSFSLIDMLNEVNGNLDSKPLLSGDNIREYISELLLIVQSDPEERHLAMYNESENVLRVMIFADTDSGKLWKKIALLTESYTSQSLDLKFQLTGYGGIMSVLVDEVTNNQIASILLAVTLVGFFLIIFFRSFLLGLIGLIPLCLTLLINLMLMSLLGLDLDITSSLIIGVVFGIGVDYSIHLIHAIKSNIASNMDVDLSIKTAIYKTSPAIMTNSVVLICGFSVLFLSSFMPIKNLGMLIGTTLFLSCISVFVMVPFLTNMLLNKK